MSVVEVKTRLIEEFEEQVPSTLNFSAGYFEGRQSSKKWLVSPEDLNAMYCTLEQSGKSEICLWCEGIGEESETTTSRKRKSSF